jgi:uncharacterized LabA/DUF88 family protein
VERRVRVFVDFWNFQLQWNHRTAKARCRWSNLAKVLCGVAQRRLEESGITDTLSLQETRIYASVNPERAQDKKLREWLDGFLGRQPGFRVFVRERRTQSRPIRCRECGAEVQACPQCAKPLARSVEKGVDAAIVTDLLSLAWEGAYDVGILLSSDSDLTPGVERLQDKGIKVVNATWSGRGRDLARVCTASVEIDQLVPALKQ